MKTKKLIASALIAVTALTIGGVNAYAATHKKGCSSTLNRVECVGPYNYTGFAAHVLYETPNGPVLCGKTAMHGAHELYCANSQCGVSLGTSFRTHAIYHAYCPTETGVCQY